MKKEDFKQIIKNASKNEDSRKKTIEAAAYLIAVLNDFSGKELSEKELENIAAGIDVFADLDTSI